MEEELNVTSLIKINGCCMFLVREQQLERATSFCCIVKQLQLEQTHMCTHTVSILRVATQIL